MNTMKVRKKQITSFVGSQQRNLHLKNSTSMFLFRNDAPVTLNNPQTCVDVFGATRVCM